MAEAIVKEGADLLYSDEDKVDAEVTKHYQPHFKPDFNLDLLCSNNYITHLLVVKRSLAEAAGPFREEMNGAQDYDFIFRCSEKAKKIVHIPEILYHWRTHGASTADNPMSKQYAYDAGRRAIEEHLERVNCPGRVEQLPDYGFYRVHYPVFGRPLVSVIIPNKDASGELSACLDAVFANSYENFEVLVVENNSEQQETFELYRKLAENPRIRLLRWKKEFNYSAINNYAARAARGEYLLFLNNDVRGTISRGWLSEMLGVCQRPEVGAVGAKLYYPDNTVQHAGIVIGIGGVAGAMFVGLPKGRGGYLHKANLMQDLSACTAACLLVKAEAFRKAGGFEEKLAVAFNDVDLCLRLRKAGYRTVFTPFARLYHYEGQTRGFRRMEEGDVSLEAKEADLFHRRHSDLGWNDPFYNRHFFSADGHFWERIPEETETRMRRLFAPYRHLPVYVTEGEARKYLEQIGASGLDVIVSDIPGEGLSEDPDGKIPIVLGGKTPEVPALEGEYLYLVDPEHLDIVRPGDRMVFATGGFAGFVTDGFIRDSTKESIGETGAGSKRNPVNEKHSAGSAQRKKVVCDVEADHFLGKGFHAPESGQAWAAEEEASIWLMLSKADQKLEIEQGHSIPLEALGWKEIILTFSVNDHRIGTGRIDAHNNGKTITISLPAAAVRDGLNKLTVSCRLWSPADLGGADRRLLGFSLKKITAKKRR